MRSLSSLPHRTAQRLSDQVGAELRILYGGVSRLSNVRVTTRIRTVLLTFVLVLIATSSALGHCVWPETPASIGAGEEFTVPVYFAHPDDPIDERDLAELSLYAVAPDGETLEFHLVKAETYNYAQVTLNQAGLHVFYAERPGARYRITQEIRDIGKSITYVDSEALLVQDPIGLDLEISVVEAVQVDGGLVEITLQILYKDSPVDEGGVEVFRSVEPGDTSLYQEIDDLDVDENGRVTLVIDPSYNYVFETDHRVPAREVDGTPFGVTQVRFRSALFLGAR